jgi:dTMP kinase
VHPESDNWFGSKARAFLRAKGKSAHFASALFYMIDVVRSILLYSWRSVDYVIFVRYLMGTAYLPTPLHTVAYNFFSTVVPKSNCMFFLDVNPEVALSRMHSRVEVEMFEELGALRKVRAKALALTRFGGWSIVNSNNNVSEVTLTLKNQLAGWITDF